MNISIYDMLIIHVPREQNCRAELLSKLASCMKPGQHKLVIRETLMSPRVDIGENIKLWRSKQLKNPG